MNIGINPNYNQYQVNNSKRQSTPTFKGLVGEQLVKDIEHLDTETVMKNVKGLMGPKKEVVADVLDTFITKIKEFKNSINLNSKKNQQLNNDIYEMERNEYSMVSNKRVQVRNQVQPQIEESNKLTNKKTAELKAAETEANKFKPMENVKSIDDLGIMMPEEAMKLMDEIVEHKEAATDSMFNYLFNGDKGEEMFKQFERNEKLWGAHENGIMNIPEVEEYKDAKKVSYNSPYYFKTDMIEKALWGNPNGSYLESYSVSQKVKERAMELLKVHAEEGSWYSNTSERISKSLDKTINDARNFHRNFKKGKENLAKRHPNTEVIIDRKGYDILESTITYKGSGEGWDPVYNFYQVSNNIY